MKNFILITIIALIASIQLRAQKESWNWYFSMGAAMTFNTKDTMPINVKDAVQTSFNEFVISDKDGNLKLYGFASNYPVNSVYMNSVIFNSKNQPIKNGYTNAAFYWERSIVVPMPGNEGIYYVFKFNRSDYNKSNIYGLFYDKIDINANNGNGDVIAKDVRVNNNWGGVLWPVKHSNGIDIWIVYISAYQPNTEMNYTSCIFRSYLLTSKGIVDSVYSDTQYPICPDGTPITSPDNNYLFGYYYSGIEFWKIDKTKGTLKKAFTFYEPNFTRGCFSPDGTKFYAIIDSIGDNIGYSKDYYYINQYTVSNGKPQVSTAKRVSNVLMDFVDSGTGKHIYPPGNMYVYDDLQYAPNGKIYISRHDTCFLAVIENPNDDADKVIVHDLGFKLNVKEGFNLPYFMNNYYNVFLKASSAVKQICQGESVPLISNISDTAAALTYKWFSPDSTTDSSKNAIFTNVRNSGYFVCEANINGAKIYDSVFVKVLPEPFFTFIGKRKINQNETIEIGTTLNDSKIRYLWSTGDTTTKIRINQGGTYKLKVINQNGCAYTDSLNIISVSEKISPTSLVLCAGDSLDIFYNASDTLDKSNKFNIYLSDAKGNFSFEVNIGAANLYKTGWMAAKIPLYQKFGTNYRIRIISSEQDTIINDSNITIYPIPEKPVISEDKKQLISSADEGNQWYLDGKLLTDSINKVINPSENGRYSVIVTDKNGCHSEKSIEFDYTEAAIIDKNKSSFNISINPNPINDNSTIEFENPQETSISISIFNQIGNEILKVTENELFNAGYNKIKFNTEKLAVGVYFCTFSSQCYTETKLLLIIK
ncbi:MAG: T9SS type A sorting domain-containing protein [Candidatus Kapabacteria bacterium]|nr:T9SS type A sorting domain-containing protein [Candidatus Kapabacteria bacterium]